MRKIFATTAVTLFLLVVTAQWVFADSASPWVQPANPDKLGAASNPEVIHSVQYVLVRFTADAIDAGRVDDATQHIFGAWYKMPVLPNETPIEALHRYAASPDVELAELDYIISLAPEPRIQSDFALRAAAANFTPNDLYYPDQWHFLPIQAPQAWDVTSGTDVTVAVIDSGISRNGEDLDCRTFVDEYNALTDSSGPGSATDNNGHGTHVAGTIAQCTNNSIGVAGLAFSADLMPIKVLDETGSGSDASIAAGINWAATAGADVINLSLGADCGTDLWPECSSDIINDAIDTAVTADAVIIAATGNNGESVVGFPANHPDVIGVGAVDFNLDVTTYSNYGDAISLTAPGGDVDVDEDNDGWPDGVLQETFVKDEQSVPQWNYWYFQGTSMAAPHVAGAAAMLRAFDPLADRSQIREALEQSALDRGDAGFDPHYGYGVVQIDDALDNLQPDPDLEQGFPVKAINTAGSYAGGSGILTLVDNIDEDQYLEIFATSLANGPLNGWKWNGEQMTGWPTEFLGASYPAVGELIATSPGLEIFAGHYGILGTPSSLAVFNDFADYAPGWPRDAVNYITSPPSLADIDGDNIDEIFIAEENGTINGYRADGSILPGWPGERPYDPVH